MNTKAIMVYFAILVVVAVLVFVVLPKSGITNTTLPSTTSIYVTSVPQSTLLPTTVQSNLSSCISSNATVQIDNGNFSTGTYAGWNVTGVGFGPTPANIVAYNAKLDYFSGPWSGYNGTYFVTNFNGGKQVSAGNLTSNSFAVSEPYLNFKIVSPQSKVLYVQILYNGAPQVTDYFNSYAVPWNSANATSTFVNASINLLPLLCKTVQVRVVAGTSIATGGNTNYDYIAVTGFYLGKRPVSSPGVLVNQTDNFSS